MASWAAGHSTVYVTETPFVLAIGPHKAVGEKTRRDIRESFSGLGGSAAASGRRRKRERGEREKPEQEQEGLFPVQKGDDVGVRSGSDDDIEADGPSKQQWWPKGVRAVHQGLHEGIGKATGHVLDTLEEGRQALQRVMARIRRGARAGVG